MNDSSFWYYFSISKEISNFAKAELFKTMKKTIIFISLLCFQTGMAQIKNHSVQLEKIYSDPTHIVRVPNSNPCSNTLYQPNGCIDAAPFCTDSSYCFPASTADPFESEGLGTIGCLSLTPNPAWYWMEIDHPGNMIIHIKQKDANGTGTDVDFIAWGPFTSVTNACENITTGSCSPNPCPSNTLPISNNFYPHGNIVDCSYDTAHVEDCRINNARTGEVYLLLLTNYAAVPASISFSKKEGSGTATTNCCIITPPASNNGPVCVGGTLQLTVPTSCRTGAIYNWTGPNGFTSNEQNPIISNVTTENAGTYTLVITAPTGAGNAVTTTVEVKLPSDTTFLDNDTICSNLLPYTKNGFNVSTAGEHILILPNSNNCDSVVVLNLFVKQISTFEYTEEICSDDSYYFNGNFYNKSGAYYDTLQNAVGCDSIIKLNLVVNQAVNDTFSVKICYGDYYEFNDKIYYTTTLVTDTIMSPQNCYIIITLDLVVNLPSDTTFINDTICFGNSYNLNGVWYSEIGTYYSTIKNSLGCDSTIVLNLFVNPKPSVMVVERDICQNDTVHLLFIGVAPFDLDYSFNGIRQSITVLGMDTALVATQSGENLFITHNLTSAQGCSLYNFSDEQGVDINGVIWATRNVGMPRTFTDTPEDAGMFYQWGKNVGWSIFNPMINSNGGTVWDWTSVPNSEIWKPENDPCPCGWRVPTQAEQWDMIGVGCTEVTRNGVLGRRSRTDRNSIFLPYAKTPNGNISGWRNEDGSLVVFSPYDLMPHSDYWAATGNEAWDLCFRFGYPLQERAPKAFCPLIRCVKDVSRYLCCTQIDTVFVKPLVKQILNETICKLDSFEFYGRVLKNNGIYTHIIPSDGNSCDTIVTLNLTTEFCSKVEVLPLVEICADDEFFEIYYNVLYRDLVCYSVNFDSKAAGMGFENIDCENIYNNKIEIPIPQFSYPKYVRPDYYQITVYFEMTDSAVWAVPITVPILYPGWIIEQKWNNVLALLNYNFNGGYKWSAYEWYVHNTNTIVPIDRGSQIYTPDYGKATLEFGEEYRAKLTRIDDGVTIFTCPMIPEPHLDIQTLPTLVDGNRGFYVQAKNSGVITIIHVSGIVVSKQNFSAGENHIQTPAQQGFYIMIFEENDKIQTTQILIVK